MRLAVQIIGWWALAVMLFTCGWIAVKHSRNPEDWR